MVVVAVACAYIPLSASALFLPTFSPTIKVEHADATLYNGNLTDIYTPPAPITINGTDLSEATSTWTITQLAPWKDDAPAGRSVYVLMRIDPNTGLLEGGTPQEGVNYSIVHVAAFSTTTENTDVVNFDLPLLGDAATPSGTYELEQIEEPATKGIYSLNPYALISTEAFTDTDLGKYLANTLPDNVGVGAFPMGKPIDFTYTAGAAPRAGCQSDCKSTVLFVPGIEASTLYGTDSAGNEEQFWLPFSDADAEQLFMEPEGSSTRSDIYTRGVIRKAYGVLDLYDSFLNRLEKWKSTDHVIADYATAPYDWRLTLQDILDYGHQTPDGRIYYSGSQKATSTPYIMQELRKLAGEGNGEVTIVAHSNGGLVAKALLKRLQDTNDPLLGHVKNLILVGAPQEGTPMAIGAALHGYALVLPFGGAPYETLTPETGRAFAQNDPMLYQLLPSATYFKGPGTTVFTPVVRFKNGTTTRAFIHAYGNAITDATTLNDFLLGRDGRAAPARSDLEHPAILNAHLLNYGTTVHEQLDAWVPPPSMKVYEIAGWGIETLSGITYKDGKKCVTALPTVPRRCTSYKTTLMYTPKTVEDGDGTVVVSSALAMSTSSPNVTRLWLNLAEYNSQHVVQNGIIGRKHINLFTIPQLAEFIKNKMVASSTAPLQKYFSLSQPLPTSDKRLLFVLHSPLSLSASDAAGGEISSSTSTIPGAAYERFGEVQYISVPAASAPTLHLVGEKSGSFTLGIQEVEGDTVVATTTFMGISSATSTTASMTFSDGTIASASPLMVDTDGNGSVDLALEPKVGATVLPDYTPPEFTITFSTSTQSLVFIATDNSGTTTTDTEAGPTFKVEGANDNRYTKENRLNRKDHGTDIRHGEKTIIARDPSGNSTVLTYRRQGLEHGVHTGTATLDSLAYDTATTTLGSVSISYVWQEGRGHHSRKSLEMTIHNGATTTVAQYDSRKNETNITTSVSHEMWQKRSASFFKSPLEAGWGDWHRSRPQRWILPGMVIPNVRTDKGRIVVAY